MTRSPRVLGAGSLTTMLIGLASLGCAPLSQLLAAFPTGEPSLEARGPGTVFPSIDAAAVDALTYAYLQGVAAHDTERMRGGTIHRVDGGYSYGAIQVAGPLLPSRLTHPVKPRDVARFVIYSRTGHHRVDRANERPSKEDRRSVRFVDPLHRPLYILHPSLVIREYRGADAEPLEVAYLRRPARLQRLAGAGPDPVQRICRLGGLSDAGAFPLTSHVTQTRSVSCRG